MPLGVGETVGDRYRVVRMLGRGGMGAVYRAWDVRLNRPVALKEMTAQLGLDPSTLAQLREQFQQEAQVLATLVHPNLVRVTDYFSWGNDEYLVMDFVEGESLAERIRREGAQPEEQAIAWAGQLLDALAYCHEQGVLHRDIKPQNIVVTPEGKATLVDFGLVKLWDPHDPRTRTVMRGAGTPEYAPPEQYDMGPGHTDPRSDIYSLGATLYHALTGNAPPTATQRMAAPSSFMPPSRINTTVSPNTESVVVKALEIAMERRFQSAEEMARSLGFTPRTLPSVPRRASAQTRQVAGTGGATPPAQQKRGAWLGLGGVGLAVVGALCLTLVAGAVLIRAVIRRGSNTILMTPTTLPRATAPALSTYTPIAESPTNTPLSESGRVLFQDSFDDTTSGWEIGEYDTGNVGYKSGFYFVNARSKSDTMWGVANRSFSDVIIDVDTTQVSAPANNNNDYGVVCREQGNGDGYYMLISGDGYYAIVKSQDGNFEWLSDWTASNAIRQGNTTNHIRAVCQGSTLEMFVNGQHLATVEDGTFTKGDIALTATSYEDEATQIQYDDLTVRAP